MNALVTQLSLLPFRLTGIPPPLLAVKFPSLKSLRPPWGVVFAVAFLSYFLVTSGAPNPTHATVAGIIYDLINEPAAIGTTTVSTGAMSLHPFTQDEATGATRPVAFMAYRVNGQYIVEGLSAGAVFAVGGIGFIVLDQSNSQATRKNNKLAFLFLGVLCIVIAYFVAWGFLLMKVPNYLG